jgi:putative endonuclease
MRKGGYVYIITNKSDRVLYTGVSANLERRISEHRSMLVPGFTETYKCTKLIYFEFYSSIFEAIAREKQIKAWRRSKKIELIKSMNPLWRELTSPTSR